MRRPDWEQRLGDYVEAHRGAVFEYGRMDCARFAAGAVRAVTGKDPMRGLRTKYRGERSAKRLIAQIGGLDGFLDGRFERVPPAFAQRGDIVMAGGSLGICIGRDAVLVGQAQGVSGLVRSPRAEWQAAWRV